MRRLMTVGPILHVRSCAPRQVAVSASWPGWFVRPTGAITPSKRPSAALPAKCWRGEVGTDQAMFSYAQNPGPTPVRVALLDTAMCRPLRPGHVTPHR